jgi:aryl-alcohol dehydrogenase-like predicted oxidoreductase
MKYRQLGLTGRRLSVIGLGAIVVKNMPQDEVNRLVAGAIDRGVNYFDFGPAYGDPEEKLGPALQGRRDGLFLACKTRERDAAGAQRELDRSLKRLRTDHFDLYQLHSMTDLEEVDQVLGSGGAVEVFQRAREQGKVRYLGFSAHSVEAAIELMRRFPFDTCLFPFNFCTYLGGNFGPQVVEAAKDAGVGLLALKGMARTKWPEGLAPEDRPFQTWYEPITEEEIASLAMRFTLSLPVSAAIPPGNAKLWDVAMRVAQDPQPLSAQEEKRVRELAAATDPIFHSVA